MRPPPLAHNEPRVEREIIEATEYREIVEFRSAELVRIERETIERCAAAVTALRDNWRYHFMNPKDLLNEAIVRIRNLRAP